MTILHDLYRHPKAKRRRAGGSGESPTKQGQVDDQTLLDQTSLHRPTSQEARIAMHGRFAETALLADWIEMVFIHFEVDRELLQAVVPFPLDTHEGKAYVSLVAFTMQRMRPALGGRATEWMTRPIASHQFLNLRTYVNHEGRSGIFFMKEWLNEKLAVLLGPKTFGLPYHYANVNYCQDDERCAGHVIGEDGGIEFAGRKDHRLAPAKPGSRDAFFLERYSAFTAAGRKPQFFRVWHQPWKIGALDGFELKNRTLFTTLREKWTDTAKLVGAHWSPGVFDVWMSRPHAVG